MLVLTLTAAGTARAEVSDDDYCRNGMFTQALPNIGLARVITSTRLYFLEDMDGCPNAEARCRQKSYVVKGDRLLIAAARGAYVCAMYPNKSGGVAGWVRADGLVAEPAPATTPISAWAGHWADGDNTLGISIKGGLVVLDGEAFWPSANPPLSQRPGGPNIGFLAGKARPTGNRLDYDDGDDICAARMVLIGPWLVVADNDRCGGMNVSFSGVYARR
jgi:hypothetical protein